MSSRYQLAALLAGMVLLLVFPLIGDRFYVQFVTKILIMVVFASSLNLLVGYTGLVSLGHAAFFGFAGIETCTSCARSPSEWPCNLRAADNKRSVVNSITNLFVLQRFCNRLTKSRLQFTRDVCISRRVLIVMIS